VEENRDPVRWGYREVDFGEHLRDAGLPFVDLRPGDGLRN
jgi:hypothetical protein